jgi:hypothetical protein
MVMTHDGKSVHYDLHDAVLRDINYSVEHGHLKIGGGRVTDVFGRPVQIQIAMDAANMHKGMKQTAISYVLINGCANPNSPQETHEFCIFEGDDHWDALRTYAKLTLLAINELIEDPNITFPGLWTAELDIVGGGLYFVVVVVLKCCATVTIFHRRPE